jgi:hypothetical protein
VVRVPGVAGDMKGGVLGGGAHGELVHVELADDNGILGLEPPDDESVVGRHELRQDLRTAGGAHPSSADRILDADRDAGQHRHVTPGDGRVGRAGVRHGFGSGHSQKGPYARVDRGNAVEHGPGQLHRRDLLAFEQAVGPGDGQLVQLHGEVLLFHLPVVWKPLPGIA